MVAAPQSQAVCLRGKARRLLLHTGLGSARRALLVFCLWMAGLAPVAAGAQNISSARYVEPTDRYDHGILGDAVEWGALELHLVGGKRVRIVLPQTRVFEDTAPRLADVDGDGGPEVIVVEASLTAGARLSVYDVDGLVAATPFIGRSHRWLSPVGAADLDGDGAVEIAYVDRPHLAKELLIWRFQGGGLVQIARVGGVTNHRIGDDYITGGIRDCDGAPEMVAVSGDWSRILGLTLRARRVERHDLGAYEGRESVERVMSCR